MATNIGPDEHAWTAGLRDAATALEGDARDDSVTMLNNGEITRRALRQELSGSFIMTEDEVPQIILRSTAQA